MGEALLSAHMAQHEILMLVAAPLLVVSRPLATWLLALPARLRRRIVLFSKGRGIQQSWARLTSPLVAWCAHGLSIWIWHVPGLYERTLTNDAVHTAQHLTFLISSLMFWWALIRGRDARHRYGASVLYVFSTAMHTSVLGVLLALSDRVWYPIYEARTAPWGLTAIEDQQLAGLIMWVPAGALYLLAALMMFGLWLNHADRRGMQEHTIIASETVDTIVR